VKSSRRLDPESCLSSARGIVRRRLRGPIFHHRLGEHPDTFTQRVDVVLLEELADERRDVHAGRGELKAAERALAAKPDREQAQELVELLPQLDVDVALLTDASFGEMLAALDFRAHRRVGSR
jgi:hypothetical protein